MCCFTRPVKSVSDTKIFARADAGERQFLVYSMQLKAGEDLAMVLPIPVKHGSGEKAVKFISLEDYSNFFDDMEAGFRKPPPPADHGLTLLSPSAAAPLEVVQVGNFEASYVPTVKDFSRLDARFHLPSGVWSKLGDYQSYGFAVFKLKSGLQHVHPMAFSFPRRNIRHLFYPTVHIHDGKVHPRAHFDHVLYGQPSAGWDFVFSGWEESYSHPRNCMKMDKTKDVVEADQHCYKKELRGTLTNRDTILVGDT